MPKPLKSKELDEYLFKDDRKSRARLRQLEKEQGWKEPTWKEIRKVLKKRASGKIDKKQPSEEELVNYHIQLIKLQKKLKS